MTSYVTSLSWCHLCKKYSLTPIVTEFVMTQNTRKPIRLLYINGILELIRKCSMLTLIKLAQMTQNSWNFIFRKSTSTEEMAYFGDYPRDFCLWSGERKITVQNLDSPGLSGRVGSTACLLIFTILVVYFLNFSRFYHVLYIFICNNNWLHMN